MIGTIKTGSLAGAKMSAIISQGLTVRTPDGKTARLAIIDEAGNIVEIGDQVAREAFNIAIESYKNFLKGLGHLRVSSPTDETKAA